MPIPDLPTAADLARYSLAAQHPRTLAWSDQPARLARLEDEHTIDLDLATSRQIAQQRHDALQAGPPPKAYLNVWREVSPGLGAMLSIRFRNGDVTQSFVDVSVTTRPVTVTDLPALMHAAGAFVAFHAPRLRFWSPAGMDTVPGLAPDQRVLAAPLVDLQDRPVPPELTLTPTVDTSHHAAAGAAYTAVDVDYPAHREQAGAMSMEDLQDTIAAGTMFDVRWRGQWSGYAGTLAHSQAGLDAHVVQELLLTPQARGQGRGAALSTLLARHLPDDHPVLSGTIHGENRGALAAATAAGRHDVGGWWWVPLG